jgi:hypothetical protein
VSSGTITITREYAADLPRQVTALLVLLSAAERAVDDATQGDLADAPQPQHNGGD